MPQPTNFLNGETQYVENRVLYNSGLDLIYKMKTKAKNNKMQQRNLAWNEQQKNEVIITKILKK